MKKLWFILLAAVFSISVYSCRETTQDGTQDSMEDVGTDIDTSTTGTYEKIETETAVA